MFTISEVREWVNNAPEISVDELTERDVIDAREAWAIYYSWKHGGRDVEIDRYWQNPEPRKQDLADLRRGFEIISQYNVRDTSRSTFVPDELPNAVVETKIPAGYVAMQPATRRVGLYPRKERRVI